MTCYEKIKDFSNLRNNARFWLEGIAITLLGLVGLAGNFLSIAVLNTYKTNTSFNRLLMSLAVVGNIPLDSLDTTHHLAGIGLQRRF